ncbi:MAG: sulfotransferase family protein [Verrucomicrobiota bacterium]
MPVPPARAIVVSGLPRSGTSLLMAMLQAGGVPLFADSLRAADDSNPRGYFEYEPVRRLAPEAPWLAETAGKAVKIVIPLVRRLPPGFLCDVLLLERALPEIQASQAAMLSLRGIPAADPAILGPAFERELKLTSETLAAFPGCRVLSIQHRDLLTRPLEVSGEIAVFLRLPLDPAAMAAVVDPALHRQRTVRGG